MISFAKKSAFLALAVLAAVGYLGTEQVSVDNARRMLTVEGDDAERQLQVAKKQLQTLVPRKQVYYTRAPVLQLQQAYTKVPVYQLTKAPINTDTGSNGDPIIMGMDGRTFKFNGRNGAWYSAISNKYFQWNMKLTQFEGCPADGDIFTTGMGLTLFDGEKEHQIEISVANPNSIYTGCGNYENKDQDFGCLGAGSLSMIVDGHKVVQAVDMALDEETQITAFNTVSMCSRRWQDFDMTPGSDIKLRESRTLRGSTGKNQKGALDGVGIFEAIEDMQKTMIDPSGCKAWMEERRQNNDLLQQTGTWSSIVIKSKHVSFHIEYKQENERCNAHNIDVWVTEVDPATMEAPWYGVIGETKAGSELNSIEKHMMSRQDALQFETDEEYEVISPFTTSCMACSRLN